MLTRSANQAILKEKFDKLPENDVSKGYYHGQPYTSPSSFIAKVYFAFTLSDKISRLSYLYPYTQAVNELNYFNEYFPNKPN